MTEFKLQLNEKTYLIEVINSLYAEDHNKIKDNISEKELLEYFINIFIDYQSTIPKLHHHIKDINLSDDPINDLLNIFFDSLKNILEHENIEDNTLQGKLLKYLLDQPQFYEKIAKNYFQNFIHNIVGMANISHLNQQQVEDISQPIVRKLFEDKKDQVVTYIRYLINENNLEQAVLLASTANIHIKGNSNLLEAFIYPNFFWYLIVEYDLGELLEFIMDNKDKYHNLYQAWKDSIRQPADYYRSTYKEHYVARIMKNNSIKCAKLFYQYPDEIGSLVKNVEGKTHHRSARGGEWYDRNASDIVYNIRDKVKNPTSEYFLKFKNFTPSILEKFNQDSWDFKSYFSYAIKFKEFSIALELLNYCEQKFNISLKYYQIPFKNKHLTIDKPLSYYGDIEDGALKLFAEAVEYVDIETINFLILNYSEHLVTEYRQLAITINHLPKFEIEELVIGHMKQYAKRKFSLFEKLNHLFLQLFNQFDVSYNKEEIRFRDEVNTGLKNAIWKKIQFKEKLDLSYRKLKAISINNKFCLNIFDHWIKFNELDKNDPRTTQQNFYKFYFDYESILGIIGVINKNLFSDQIIEKTLSEALEKNLISEKILTQIPGEDNKQKLELLTKKVSQYYEEQLNHNYRNNPELRKHFLAIAIAATILAITCMLPMSSVISLVFACSVKLAPAIGVSINAKECAMLTTSVIRGIKLFAGYYALENYIEIKNTFTRIQRTTLKTCLFEFSNKNHYIDEFIKALDSQLNISSSSINK